MDDVYQFQVLSVDAPDAPIELIAYADALRSLDTELSNDTIWQFKDILDHIGPLQRTDPDYRGSSYNLKILWEDGSITYEPLSQVATDTPIVVAQYAKEHGLF